MKTRKRIVNCFLAVCMMLTLAFPAAATQVTVNTAYFQQYYVDGSALKAVTTTRTADVDGVEVSLSSTLLRMWGQTEQSKSFDVRVVIENEAFTAAADLSGNYNVLAVLDVFGYFRVVLQDKIQQDMMYLDFVKAGNTDEEYVSLNQNWYNAFVTADLDDELAQVEPMMLHSTRSRRYDSTTNIYGDIITEYLTVTAYF